MRTSSISSFVLGDFLVAYVENACLFGLLLSLVSHLRAAGSLVARVFLEPLAVFRSRLVGTACALSTLGVLLPVACELLGDKPGRHAHLVNKKTTRTQIRHFQTARGTKKGFPPPASRRGLGGGQPQFPGPSRGRIECLFVRLSPEGIMRSNVLVGVWFDFSSLREHGGLCSYSCRRMKREPCVLVGICMTAGCGCC